MCGIIGIASFKDISKEILESLKKLEYRGYDSAGISTINNGEIIVSSTLIAIFIQKPTSISNTTYQNTALQFLVRVDDEASLNKEKNNSKVLLFVFVMLLLIIVISTYLPNHQ